MVYPCKKEKWKEEKGNRDKADQGGVKSPQKAVKAWMALQEATPRPVGNWSSVGGASVWKLSEPSAPYNSK